MEQELEIIQGAIGAVVYISSIISSLLYNMRLPFNEMLMYSGISPWSESGITRIVLSGRM